MSRVIVYNTKKEKTGTLILPPELFDLKISSDLIHQALVTQMANSRKKIAQTKDRSEVRGGGVKPWQQKGTGRARHGSIRSPIWKGGGITFGPRTQRNFKKKINKKMKRKALFMALSSKLKDNELILINELKLKKPKTKEMAKILENFIKKENKIKSILIILSKKDQNIIRASKNIPFTKTILVNNLNILDLLSFKYLLITKPAIKIIKETYARNI